MARAQTDLAITLSVLDRLIDQDPKNTSEAPAARAQSVRELKTSLRRDLEWLLNTRRIAIEPPESLRELNRSLYMYGLPDFSAFNVSSARDQNRLIRILQGAVKLFEPRLANVRIVPGEMDTVGTRKVRFRIEGLLLMDPAPEHISFDTVLQLNNGEYEVKGAAMRDDLLLYYERELTYLRQSAVQFAEKYPKVASRLVLEPSKCEDPHVERLLEAFAFLAARVHLKIDDEFPEISEALLGVLYPHFIRPIPSMSIVEFQLDADQGKLSTGLPVERGSVLHSRPVNGIPCKFRTCYDTTLWPVSVAAAEWKTPDRLQPAMKATDASAALRIELSCGGDAKFPQLEMDSLRFYLDGEASLLHSIYELLCCKLVRIVVRDPTPGTKIKPVTLPASSLRPVGFGLDEGMLPYPSRSFPGYRLLQEFFTFPEKFFFLDVTGLEQAWAAGFKDTAEIVFLVAQAPDADRRERLEIGVTAKTFRLGCAPVINLFAQTAEPILLDQTKYEYPVTPDARRPTGTEIFSIDSVDSIDSETRQIISFEPFYSFHPRRQRNQKKCFWLAHRQPSTRPNDEGTEMAISLVDLSTRPLRPDCDTLTVRTTCTNRDLPTRLQFGNEAGDFELEGAAAVRRIVALKKPTAPLRPPSGKGALWSLISHLSLNYLSLVEGGKDALQQILRVYNFTNSNFPEKMIEGITGLRGRRHFARVVSENGITFTRGTRVELELDEEQFVGGGVYLFASVLEHFLGHYASLNSFSQLVATTKQRKEVLREWAPRAGQKILM